MTIAIHASRGIEQQSIGTFIRELNANPDWTWLEPSPTRHPINGFTGLWKSRCPDSALDAEIDEARLCWQGSVLHLVRSGSGLRWALMLEDGHESPINLPNQKENVRWDNIDLESQTVQLAGPNQLARLGAIKVDDCKTVTMVTYRHDGSIIAWGIKS